MADKNNILEKLDGLEARFEEVSTLITDPDVIADQGRYVKLTKEYKDLSDIMDARKRFVACINAISEAKDIIANESDPDMKEMAREELAENEELRPSWRKKSNSCSCRRIPRMRRMCRWRSARERVAMRLASSRATSLPCTSAIATAWDGS